MQCHSLCSIYLLLICKKWQGLSKCNFISKSVVTRFCYCSGLSSIFLVMEILSLWKPQYVMTICTIRHSIVHNYVHTSYKTCGIHNYFMHRFILLNLLVLLHTLQAQLNLFRKQPVQTRPIAGIVISPTVLLLADGKLD